MATISTAHVRRLEHEPTPLRGYLWEGHVLTGTYCTDCADRNPAEGRYEPVHDPDLVLPPCRGCGEAL